MLMTESGVRMQTADTFTCWVSATRAARHHSNSRRASQGAGPARGEGAAPSRAGVVGNGAQAGEGGLRRGAARTPGEPEEEPGIREISEL